MLKEFDIHPTLVTILNIHPTFGNKPMLTSYGILNQSRGYE
jgi:hypothetical protein